MPAPDAKTIVSILWVCCCVPLSTLPAAAGTELSPSLSSSTISGRVVDGKTHDPIENVNVFLANTTIGTTTGRDGRYLLKKIPGGAYDLVVSHIGYEVKSFPLQLVRPDSLSYEITLQPRVLTLGEIQVIAPKPDAWKKDLHTFLKAFVGESANAKACRILNPEVLNFQWEPHTGTFLAAADSLLRVDNRALGYRLHIILKMFRLSHALTEYVMIPRFEELIPHSEQERQQWIKNRQRSYEGSLKHFLSTLARGQLGPFTLWSLSDPTTESRTQSLASQPALVSPDTLGLHQVRFNEYLGVAYTFERSVIKLNTASALIDTLGHLYTPLAFTTYGRWGQDRLADLLPADYEPTP